MVNVLDTTAIGGVQTLHHMWLSFSQLTSTSAGECHTVCVVVLININDLTRLPSKEPQMAADKEADGLLLLGVSDSGNST